MHTIEIHTYREIHQKDIDLMIKEIGSEYLLPITKQNHSNRILLDEYWIALYKSELVGTIGLINIGNNSLVLKNMFVKKEFRGKKTKLPNYY